MAKNKEYNWSKYQEDIFDFIKNGKGNCVVEACAGSGKTTSLIKCLDFINDDMQILLTAFNRDIVSVLEKKSKGMDNVKTMTLHSLGLQMMHRNYPKEALKLDEFKYKTFINTNLKELSSINTWSLGKKEYVQYIDNIFKLIEFGRYYLSQTIKDLEFIEDRYAIETIADEKEIAIIAMEWGKISLDTIDYTDMVWLPNVLMCQPQGLQFDWIFCDECQDLNVAQRSLLLKCRKINTRMVSLGDSSQMLYAFSGGDPDSFYALKTLPNTISLPLSISYRCASKIVDFAKELVPTIEYSGDGREGEILYDVNLNVIEDGDMVLCRNNAPLMQIYTTLIKNKKKCFIRGKDIGTNLKRIVKNTKQKYLSVDLHTDGVFPRLYKNLFETRDKLMLHSNINELLAMDSAIIMNKLDIIETLKVLAEGVYNTDDLIEKIDGVFSDRKKNGIALSTIHKAKGLEAENVYIACKSLMPSKAAKKDWEIRQEFNLMYVAYTRAKNKLGFIDESGFENFNMNESKKIAMLKVIEAQVNRIYGKSDKILSSNTIYASEIVKRAKKIEKPHTNTKILPISKEMTENKNGLKKLVSNSRKITKLKRI